jgi:type IV pilus assembly protein PilM
MIEARPRNFLIPPPAFILLPAVGIDISDRSIKFAKLIPMGEGYRLGEFGSVPLAPGIVEGGRIIAPERLEETLGNLRRAHDISFVRAALPEEQMYFFRTTIPAGPREVLRDTIELSLEEHVPITGAEAVFDFEVVGHNGADVEVAVTAASRAVVESYTDTFAGAGLTLLSLELEAEAIARTVLRKEDNFAHLIVDFGETRTGIAISYAGQVYFTSTIGIGGRMLTETLAKHFNIPMPEAESMKREFGLTKNTEHQDLFALLLNNVAVLRDEINKHFIYWHTHADENGNARPAIEEIVLVGGDSNLSGLPDYLSASLRVKTSVANVWTNVKLPDAGVPELSRNDSLGYATAIGLSLHEAASDQTV